MKNGAMRNYPREMYERQECPTSSIYACSREYLYIHTLLTFSLLISQNTTYRLAPSIEINKMSMLTWNSSLVFIHIGLNGNKSGEKGIIIQNEVGVS